MTICLLTDEMCPFLDLRPKTRYPPNNPAKNVSYGPSFPGSEPMCFSNNIVNLYTVAYFARFWACVRVAFNISFIFSSTVPDLKRKIILYPKFISRLCRYVASIVERDSHQRMWESHFRSIDSAIPSTLQHSQDICILGIENDALKRFLSTSILAFVAL
jgi:hypothetical protein